MWSSIVNFFRTILAFILMIFGISIDGNLPTYANIEYGSLTRQVMDIYYPEETESIEDSVDAFLFIHGGGWASGDKSVYKQSCLNMAESGFVAATMNYRMFQQGATFVEMLEDIDLALTKLKEQTLDDGIEIDKVVLMGASAGGHLSLLYSYTHYETSPIPIGFVVGQVPPVDFLDPNLIESANIGGYALVSMLVGETITSQNYEEHLDLIQAASPYYQADENVPPTILAFGALDSLVPLTNGERMHQKLTDLNVPHEYFVYPSSGHGLENDPNVNTLFFEAFNNYIYLYLN